MELGPPTKTCPEKHQRILFPPLKLNLKMPTYRAARIARIYLKSPSVVRKSELYSGSTICLTGEVFLIYKRHLFIDWSS
jgi:hypothetical protein